MHVKATRELTLLEHCTKSNINGKFDGVIIRIIECEKSIHGHDLRKTVKYLHEVLGSTEAFLKAREQLEVCKDNLLVWFDSYQMEISEFIIREHNTFQFLKSFYYYKLIENPLFAGYVRAELCKKALFERQNYSGVHPTSNFSLLHGCWY